MTERPPTRPRPPRAEAFPRGIRVRSRPEYSAIYETGRRLPGRFVVVFARAAEGEGRLGITATRKVGGAVVRNRARRRVREAYRRWRAGAPRGAGLDFVVNLSGRGAAAPFAALSAELVSLFDRAAREPRPERP